MAKTLNFRYIKHSEINSERWNRCIDNAQNCRIYAYDWHLDRTAEVWDALVWGDYEFVMPLPYRKKLGVKYLYQPLYSQQLGIFPSPTPKIEKAFYKYLTENFSYSDFHLNAENLQPGEIGELQFLPRKNLLLPLVHEYEILSASFSKNTKRNIAKARQQELNLVKGIRLQTYMNFKAENLQAKIGKKELASLKSLISYGLYKGFGQIYGVYTANNQLCAAVYFCRWKERVIYFNAASSQTGKELGAMYFLLNKFIEENAGKNLILDFEGSMIPGVARFYNGFGAKAETYFQLKFNRLPLPFKWFKRK
ncbi:hypothetical protein OU798_20255 [Prolixibacteraceae bacterium Z1-6]|uniref:BioF2-like acetyltransferase domain-containing protein n=1 Tax=Draconibacterium aestuarii TaxID=2998507 RepID=A0A9X3F8S5_9BACT|nr:hypothetical protein [Prolixibacteraceae bacterium Z1-6]